MAGVGFALILIPDNDVDSYFEARIRRPSYSGRNRPVVLIDEAHGNSYTIEGRFLPLARLLRQDGYIAGPNLRRITKDSLRGIAVLIIGNPKAVSAKETAALREWISEGGSLLLAIDSGPAAAFGIEMAAGNAGSDVQLLRREAGQIASHAITDGRVRVEQVERVMTFGGQGFHAPASASPLLLAPNGAMGFALEVGKGRIAVLGNAAMITAQRTRNTAIGFNRGGNDNVRLVLNLLHWLSRL